MSLAFYMDVHVPRAITRALRIRGIDVITAQEDGTAEFDDPPLLDRARDLGRILFTRDEDFLIEADARERRGEPFGGFIYRISSASPSVNASPILNSLAKQRRRGVV